MFPCIDNFRESDTNIDLVVPPGATTTGFAFNGVSDGVSDYLTWNGVNNFWGCQNAETSLLNAFQITWFGDGEPNGEECIGPLKLYADFTCNTSD